MALRPVTSEEFNAVDTTTVMPEWSVFEKMRNLYFKADDIEDIDLQQYFKVRSKEAYALANRMTKKLVKYKEITYYYPVEQNEMDVIQMDYTGHIWTLCEVLRMLYREANKIVDDTLKADIKLTIMHASAIAHRMSVVLLEIRKENNFGEEYTPWTDTKE